MTRDVSQDPRRGPRTPMPRTRARPLGENRSHRDFRGCRAPLVVRRPRKGSQQGFASLAETVGSRIRPEHLCTRHSSLPQDLGPNRLWRFLAGRRPLSRQSLVIAPFRESWSSWAKGRALQTPYAVAVSVWRLGREPNPGEPESKTWIEEPTVSRRTRVTGSDPIPRRLPSC